MLRIPIESFEGYKAVTVYGIKFKGKVVYVGITTGSVKQRVFKHFSHARSLQKREACPKLYEHIRNNPELVDYSLSILDQCTRDQGEEREKFFIEKYDTLENGLNKTSGGNWSKGSDHYLYGKRVDRHIVEASVAARIGKKLSDEHKAKLRAAHVGRRDMSHPIVCLDTGEIFPSISEAARLKNISRVSLLRHINGLNKSCGGLTFCRQGSERIEFVPKSPKQRGPLPQEHIEKLRAAALKRADYCLTIRCVNTGEKFSSVAEASRATNLSVTSIRRCALGVTKSTLNGMRFERI